MKLLLLTTILAIIFSISAYQPFLNDPYGADQNEKLHEIIKMNEYLTGRFEKSSVMSQNDYYSNEEGYEKLMSSTVQHSASPSTSTQTTKTSVSNTTDIFEELYDKLKEPKGEYEDEQEDEDANEYENDYRNDVRKNKSAIIQDHVEDDIDDEYNSIYQDMPNKEYEISLEKLIQLMKNTEKSRSTNLEEDDDDDDEENEYDQNDADNTDEDFDYTTQNNDAVNEEEKDEDEDEDYEEEEKDSQKIKSVFNNLFDFIQLNRLLTSVSDIFKQSLQPAQAESSQEMPNKKSNKLIVLLFSNKTMPKPSSLSSPSSSPDYEQETVIRSAPSKSDKECSDENVKVNILRTITKVSLFLASVSLCLLILLTLLRFCLVRNKNSSSYNKLENVDTILEKV